MANHLHPNPHLGNNNHHQQQQIHLPPASSGSVSPSSAYQHFQPWRSCIKMEKGEQVESPEQAKVDLFYNSMSTDSAAQLRTNSLSPFYPQLNYPAAQKLAGHPEMDLKLQQCIDEGNCVGDFAKKQIVQILESISLLKPPERVLLYLRMPGANCEADPLRQPQNPLGARSEINHTINWVRSHLEPDPNVSIPKKDVYDDYTAFCGRNNIKPLSTADFGKVMKQVFPTVRPRRLGTRGNSRYCYAAMRKATKLDPPLLPDLSVMRSVHGEVEGLNSGDSLHLLTDREGGGESVDRSSIWPIIQKWAEGLLMAKFDCAKDLADHIVQNKLVGGDSGADKLAKIESNVGKDNKIKDKRKEPLKPNSPKKRRKKRRKDSSSASAEGSGCESEQSSRLLMSAVQVKKEVDSGNDEENIIDLKIQNRDMAKSKSDDHQVVTRAPVKLMLNDVPMDPAVPVSEAESLQIENVYCKKVRQAQQAKGLWFQPQQQSNTSLAQSSVIVTPHTFSQPEIPSPSMLNQMNQIRQQVLSDRESKNLSNKDVGSSDDTIPRDFILPRERVISLCALDKDALDDYLPLAGDNSQEAEIMEYFDENSSNGQSTVDADNGSPKALDESQTTTNSVEAGGSSSNLETYSIFGVEQRSMGSGASFGKQGNQNSDSQEKLRQLKQIMHLSFQQPVANSVPRPGQTTMSATTASGGGPSAYPGSASASLYSLSQRHNLINYAPTVVGMDLSQDPGNIAGRPLSLKKRVIEENEEVCHRRFVPISTPPNSAAPLVDYTKSSAKRNSTSQSRYDEFLNPKMAAMKKHHQQQQMDMHILRPCASQEPSPLPLVHGSGTANGLSVDHHGRNTAFSRPKYDRPSPSDAQHQVQEALNMSTFAESRSQSVPLNYRQSPVQLTSSNDGASWSSSFQNTNNAPSSACSSVAQTPIPTDYNDFTEMMNIWDNEPVMPVTSCAETGASSSEEPGERYKDRNNNGSAEEFMDEMKAFAGTSTNSITSRSVPSTPLPTATSSYYPKAYYNNSSSQSNGMGGFSNYGEQGRCYDASKSVPTTPIASVSSSQFRYSPIVDVLNRSRDSLINGNIILDKELGAGTSAGFGFTDGQNPVDVEGAMGLAEAGDGGASARRRIGRIEEDRKNSSSQGGLMGDKEMSPLDEEMGFDMDTDLMNPF